MSKTVPIWPDRPISPEPWVDINAVAKHLGFGYQATAKMVKKGMIPGKPIRNGKKTFWRFRLSIVDAAMENHGNSQGSNSIKSTTYDTNDQREASELPEWQRSA